MRHSKTPALSEFDFLSRMTAEVVAESRVPPGTPIGSHGVNTTNGTLIRPGGRNCYPAFWIRDFAMSLESGLITTDELRHALFLTAQWQMRQDWQTPGGSWVPRGSIPDHITLAGKPIYFPGTLDDAVHQGDPWGNRPPFDDQFYFIDMAWHLAMAYHRPDCLTTDAGGMSLLDCLNLAFDMPPSRPHTDLVHCDASNRGVSSGFVDTIVHTGDLLFSSLLKYRAAQRMAQLHSLYHDTPHATAYDQVAGRIASSLFDTFGGPDGWLRASTGCSAQPDVWGSAFAIYTGALQGVTADRVCDTIRHAYTAGTISWKGYIRHVPTNADYDTSTAWECLVRPYPKNRYQNGAYWGTPTGWLCFALAQQDDLLARELALEFIRELQDHDFRQGDPYGSPFECMHPDGDYQQNPVYMTSVTCPLAAFQRLGWTHWTSNHVPGTISDT